ncbi:MAG: glycoside hydrolase family 15 protein [Actinomycetota bacterium]|nr:glycoside hydrolase family 15 protein [Actinomycetota bacterium]
MKIEDYALIGDTQTAALVSRAGSIDWLCLPRFDSGACFAALLGDDTHGHWSLAPAAPVTTTRRYRDRSLVLETEHVTETGTVRVVDFMPVRGDQHPKVVRLVEGMSGLVGMTMDLVLRFEYGSDVPWVRRTDTGLHAIAGPNATILTTPVELSGHHLQTTSTFDVAAGERVPFVLSWYVSHEQAPGPLDPVGAVRDTVDWWRGWCEGVTQVHGPWEDVVLRSLITLKALTYAPTGGIVAAPTTSLPEDLGGVRNWDYRYCWVRDATLTLDALIEADRRDEAEAWLWWLVRAAAGAPEQLQIMYGPAGERRLSEFEVDWLPGYEGSAPVRIGNAAADQFQLDVYGELMDATDRARHHGMTDSPVIWDLQRSLIDFVVAHWQDPDDGIWEVRGPRRPFVHSKVMAWVAMDRAVAAVERYGLDGPVADWREVRDAIHAEVCAKGYNAEVGAFTQYYGSDRLDASVLLLPAVGFLPCDDPRIMTTVDAVRRELLVNGFVLRYQNDSGVDGLPGGEGAFLPCSFWLVDCLAFLGRVDEARELFERLVALTNDVGLLSEEYDTARQRLVGNFPQAFSHVGLINSARNLAAALAGTAGVQPPP